MKVFILFLVEGVLDVHKQYLAPAEITEYFIGVGRKKAALCVMNQIILGIIAGAFVALACQGTNVAIHTIESVGLSKALAGILFSTALMLVLLAGGELFTGNCLMVMALADRKIALRSMLRGWLCVYAGNFIGSMLIVFLINRSGQLGFSSGMLGGFTIKQAAYKTGLTFEKAFIMGILCNWMVCIAVWMAAAAIDVTGKISAILFPIWLFVTSGFEHSIANMYYIPAGIFAKANPAFAEHSVKLGVTAEELANLNWGSFFAANLLPVTLGNIVGGVFFVGLIYWFIYRERPCKGE